MNWVIFIVIAPQKCITNHSWHTHTHTHTHTFDPSVCCWGAGGGVLCFLIKLEGAVVFGETILVFVFPKSPTRFHFGFTTQLWTPTPFPHNEVSRHCGTGVSVSARGAPSVVCLSILMWNFMELFFASSCELLKKKKKSPFHHSQLKCALQCLSCKFPEGCSWFAVHIG